MGLPRGAIIIIISNYAGSERQLIIKNRNFNSSVNLFKEPFNSLPPFTEGISPFRVEVRYFGLFLNV